MFWSKKIKKDMIPKISFSSRATLKKEALLLANGDLEKASKIYDFLIKDMEEIPIIEPVPATTFEQIKDTAGNIFNWAKDNKDNIAGFIDWIRNFKSAKPAAPSAPITPLPKI